MKLESNKVTDITLTFSGRVDDFFDMFIPDRFDNISSKSVILDVGCSGGITTLALLRRFHPKLVIGIDIVDPKVIVSLHPQYDPSPTRIEEECLRYMQGDMFHLSELEIPSADLIIFGNNILSYMMRRNDIDAGVCVIKEVRKKLNMEGRIIFFENGISSRTDYLIVKKTPVGIISDMEKEDFNHNFWGETVHNTLLEQVNM